jgi:hypothetical protein
MEEAGWIERRADPADRRARRLFMTGKARPILGRILDVANETRDEALGRLKPGEAGQLIDLLKRVHATLSERVPHPADNLDDNAGATPIPPSPRRAAATATSRDGVKVEPAPVAAVEAAR